MITFRVPNARAVVAGIQAAGGRVERALRVAIPRLLLQLEAKVKAAKLSGQVLKNRTGTLRRSIGRARQVLESAGLIRGQTGTNLEYAAGHEYGIKGELQRVKQHWRTIDKAWGKQIPKRSVLVDAFERRMTLPERSYLRSALAEMAPEVLAEMQRAVGGALRGAPAALLVLLAACAGHRPDFDLLRPERDGFTAPRIVHQATRVAGGVAAYGAFRGTGMAPGPSGVWGCAVSGFVPHMIGYARGAYPFNGPDWVTDAVTGCGSAVVAALCEQRRGCRRALGAFTLGWALAAPWGRP